MMLNVVVLEQQMQAKRDAAEAAAAAAELEENDDDDDDDDVFDGGPAGPGEAGKLVAIRRSPSGDSFATLATEQQLDKLDKRFVGDSRLELSGLQDRLSVASVHSPVDHIAVQDHLSVASVHSPVDHIAVQDRLSVASVHSPVDHVAVQDRLSVASVHSPGDHIAVQDHLSVASVHSPGDYIALPTVSSLSLFTVLPRLPNVVENVEGSKHRKSLILLKKLVFISNFNVFILMFVIYFLS